MPDMNDIAKVVSKPFRPTIQALLAAVGLAVAFWLGIDKLGAFVDIRAKAVWAEEAVRSSKEHEQYTKSLNNHEDRINTLEKGQNEIRQLLIEQSSISRTTAEDVKEIKVWIREDVADHRRKQKEH